MDSPTTSYQGGWFGIVAMPSVMGFVMASFGPVLPVLGSEFGVSRTILGLHYTLLAVGGLVLGLVLHRIIGRFGRAVIYVVGGSAIIVGAGVVGVAGNVYATLLGALTIGLGGTTLLTVVRASMATGRSARLATSMTHIDISFSIGSLLPGAVAALVFWQGVSWRIVYAVPVVVGTCVLYLSRRDPILRPQAGPMDAPGSLPKSYWLVWIAAIPSVAAEWSISAWAADFASWKWNVADDIAALILTVFYSSMLIGRLIGIRWFTGRVRPERIFSMASVLAAAAAVGTILAPSPWVGFAAIALAGVGTSLLVPMLLAMAVVAAPSNTDKAAARMSLAASIAILSAPVLLGGIADQFSIEVGFYVVPLLYVVSLVVLGPSLRTATG